MPDAPEPFVDSRGRVFVRAMPHGWKEVERGVGDVLSVECPACVCEFEMDRADLLADCFAECPECGHECGQADMVNDG